MISASPISGDAYIASTFFSFIRNRRKEATLHLGKHLAKKTTGTSEKYFSIMLCLLKNMLMIRSGILRPS
ncbi:MAG: hypothetical protein ACP5NK_01420 [Thermoplasmata archaeon]